MTTLGERITTRRDARYNQQPRGIALPASVSDESRNEIIAYIDDQIAALHARIDKLSVEKKSPPE